ncbi:MAG: hypothetical protein AAF725_14735 [Acidobacteriota bacterium]
MCTEAPPLALETARAARPRPVCQLLASLLLTLAAGWAGPGAAEAQDAPPDSPPPAQAVEPAEALEPEEDLVPLLDPSADPAPPPPVAGGVDFDLEVARRKLETEFGTRPDAVDADEIFDIAPTGELDDSVRRLPLRGAREAGLDLRSVERFHWQCRSDLGRRGLTLFGNGTVRLKTGTLTDPEMYLDELTPELTVEYLNRIAGVSRTRRFRAEVESAALAIAPLSQQARGEGYRGPERSFGVLEGRWLEACLLRLRLPDTDPVELWLPRLEVPSLELSQLVAIADELADFTRPVRQVRGLGVDYVPIPGDLLRRGDGQLLRVVGITIDGGGVELESLSEPTRIYYLLKDLPRLFTEKVRPGTPSRSSTEGREPEVRELTRRPGGGG